GRARLRPGPATLLLVAQEGELVPLTGQGKAHPLSMGGVEELCRLRLQQFLEFLVGEPGERGGVEWLRALPLPEEGDRAGAVTAQLADQGVAVGGVKPQSAGQRAPAPPLRQEALNISAAGVGAGGLAAQRRGGAEQGPGVRGLSGRLGRVGEAVTALTGREQPADSL